MKTRIISALVALPLLIFVIVSGGMWTHIGIAVLGLVGMYEFNKAISKEVKGTHIIAYIFGLIYVIFIDKIIYTAPLFSVFTSLFTIALLVYSVLCYKKTNYVEVVAALFGFFYACFLLSHVYLVREYDHGKLLIWLAFISAFGCDTGAYFTGYFLGKNKLCPALSPKKTIEG
ncbi:MAG: phosphatidate cytidylyltransferase, partial [Anaerotignum sp.]|nr:phosphatidate cytidylyltransferase [Anaerotignum sp.]